MTKLYSDLAYLYDAMYQTFIDYDKEFGLYADLLRQHQAKSVLEIGCGSGHLAKRFTNQHYDYRGVDISPQMLDIARRRCPQTQFEQADMRTITSERLFDAVLITARSISYIIHNQEVLSTLRHIGQCLPENGKLIFDFIDAATFLPDMDESALIEHWAIHEQQSYLRQSRYVPNLATGLTWDWHSAFFVETPDGQHQPIGTDLATLRAFLPDEIRLLLQLAGFRLIEEHVVQTYAFSTVMVVAIRS
ncbi:class I SAM-dependent DNA methyltransferase [Spirosoma arcticum]